MLIALSSKPPASSTLSEGSAAWANAAAWATRTVVAIRIALFIANSLGLDLPGPI
jgi:hypothetical protein